MHRNEAFLQQFKIRSIGNCGAAEVRIPLDFLRRAKAICAEEIGLIDVEIAARNIPFPKAIPKARQAVCFTAELLQCADAVPAPGAQKQCLLRGRVAGKDKDSARGWQRLFPRKLLIFLARIRLSKLAQKVLEQARFGSIMIVGQGLYPCALAENLCRLGRDAVVLSGGRGAGTMISPGYLMRPEKGSLIDWILADPANLEKAGAIIFLGEEDFTLEIDALRAAANKPPVVFASGQRLWWHELVSVHPGGLPGEDAVADGKRWPCISIVIVSFNQAAFLEATIRSVIDQAYPNLDLIIVDGGSTDGSVAIIDRYRAHFAHVVIEPDKGQSDALNKGFALAKGEVLNWLCSDDLLEPDALRHIAEAYVSTGADLIVGGCVRFGKTRSDELYRHHTALVIGRKVPFDAEDVLNYTRSWLKANYFFQPEVFFSWRIWKASGGHIKRHLYYLMDYDLWLRMALAGASIYHVPVFLGCSRVHAEQKTMNLIEVHQARQIMAEYQDFFCALETASALAKETT